jgi:hypothetical protein
MKLGFCQRSDKSESQEGEKENRMPRTGMFTSQTGLSIARVQFHFPSLDAINASSSKSLTAYLCGENSTPSIPEEILEGATMQFLAEQLPRLLAI